MRQTPLYKTLTDANMKKESEDFTPEDCEWGNGKRGKKGSEGYEGSEGPTVYKADKELPKLRCPACKARLLDAGSVSVKRQTRLFIYKEGERAQFVIKCRSCAQSIGIDSADVPLPPKRASKEPERSFR